MKKISIEKKQQEIECCKICDERKGIFLIYYCWPTEFLIQCFYISFGIIKQYNEKLELINDDFFL